MKKAILFIFHSIIFIFATTMSNAQSADSSNVASKSSEIVTLLTSKLGLTKTQIPAVQGLVSDFAVKFAKTNPKTTVGGLKARLEKDEQSTLVKDFSAELPKLLTAIQSPKYAGIKDKISALFMQIK